MRVLPGVAIVSSQVGEDGQYPAVAVVGLGEVDLEQDVPDVPLDGAFTDDESPGDRGIVQAFSHQREDFTFAVGKRAARSGRNPRTGAQIKIKAAKVPKFRPGKALKDALN